MILKTFAWLFFTGPLHLFKSLLKNWWLKSFKAKYRLSLYDPKDLHTTRNGPFLTTVEEAIEKPVQFAQENLVDSVLFFGGNSHGDRLVVKVSRECEGNCQWLYLELKDGRTYQPPETERIFPPSGDYAAGGLKLKCLVPMRKWRISFNGLLRESKKGTSGSRTVHVQFSFLCFSSATPLDLYAGIPPSTLWKSLSTDLKCLWSPNFKLFEDKMDRFVQPTNMIGTIKVGDQNELEKNLWGLRQKSKDPEILPGKSSGLKEILGYTRDGQVIYSGEYNLPGFINKMVFGLHLERCGFTWPTAECRLGFDRSKTSFNGVSICIKNERKTVNATVGSPSVSLNLSAGLNKGFTARTYLTDVRTEDGDLGYALVLEYEWRKLKEVRRQPLWILPPINGIAKTAETRISSSSLVLPLGDIFCQARSVSGGKGSSLSTLTYLALKYNTNFKVPSGFVITTAAYSEFLRLTKAKTLISNFASKMWRCKPEDFNSACQLMVEEISKTKLPESIEEAVRHQLGKQFSNDFGSKRFAIRSSAAGEDSEDMSAAGQMATFLGVDGFERISEAIVKCWASQFLPTAIQYKRQNGQELNSMMAVVVQEMVPADIAGVLFTCDPVTGDPQNVTVTANYGIGESVVSASAEPDTVVLNRSETQEVVIQSIGIGRKDMKVVMTAEGSIVEEQVKANEKNVCCISNENSTNLADTALKIEEAYGVPVDVEWAYRDGQLFILQARPITTIDKETRCELIHSADDSLKTEDEYNTTANAGEVLPIPGTHIGMSWLVQTIAALIQNLYVGRNPYFFPWSPFTKMFTISQNYLLLSLPHYILRFYTNEAEKSFVTEASLIATFGRIIEDQEMFDHMDKRNRTYPTSFVPYQTILFIRDMIFGMKWLRDSTKRLKKENFDIAHCSNSMEMITEIWKRSMETLPIPANLFTCSYNSILYNNIVLAIFRAANKEWNSTVFSDFASILSSCGGVESADVPFSIQKLAKAIRDQGDADKFKKMDAQEALKWLEASSTPAADRFREFIQRHGHRCLMEFDLYRKPWRMDKLPLIKTLQESVDVPFEEKQFVSASETIEKFKSQLSWKQKLFLRVLIPLCRRSVMGRENSKALIIKYVDCLRPTFWKLADQMVKEGRLPEPDLMFFLTTDELVQYIRTRDPTWVRRAIRRRAVFPELDQVRFPEICKGVPVPVNPDSRPKFEDFPSDLQVKGTPVSQGIVRGIARVAVTLQDAAFIKPGEILIAHGTDIAWSPYFPLLKGIATELGGLVSHGAVVAREYGLPCVVGVFDATVKFKTGDHVVLDGNKGTLTRIPKSSTNDKPL